MGSTAISIAPSRSVLRCGAFLCAVLVVVAALAHPAKGTDGEGASNGAVSGSTDAPVDYATGVRIDWRHRVVEVDAKVCLTRGPLELLLCSPNTREHESIFVTPARPVHVYEALGLIGLTPGKPVHYDENGERWVPPTGESVEISVECTGSESKSISHFVKAIGEDAGPISPTWVFAGSKRFPDGRLGADPEGTIIAVVDFETAIVAPSSLHSDSNEALWLEAKPSTIPKIGTECVVRFAAAQDLHTSLRLRVTAGGGLERDGKVVPADEVVRLLREEGSGVGAGRRVVLVPDPDATRTQIRVAVAKLVEAGVERDRIEVPSATGEDRSKAWPKND